MRRLISNPRMILFFVVTMCLLSFGCKTTAKYQTAQAAPHAAAAREALSKFDGLQKNIENTWTQAQKVPPTEPVGDRLQAILDDVSPKIKQQAVYLAAANKELSAADKLLLPTEYHAYLRFLKNASGKKEQARKLSVKAVDETTAMLKDLPTGATGMQVPLDKLTLLTQQFQTSVKLLGQAADMQKQAEALKTSQDIKL